MFGIHEEEEELTALKPILPCTSEFTSEELRDRMARNEPPLSSEEYLARVMLEAHSTPKILVASTTPIPFHSRPITSSSWKIPSPIPLLSEHELGHDQRESIRITFTSIQDELIYWESKFEGVEVASRGTFFDVPTTHFPVSTERMQWMEFFQSTPPLMHVLLQMDNVAVVRGLKHIGKALSLQVVLDHTLGSWIFALLARVDVTCLLMDEVASCLRAMLRLIAAMVVAVDDSHQEAPPHLVLWFLLQDIFRVGE